MHYIKQITNFSLSEAEKKKLMKCRKWLNPVDPATEYKRHQNAKLQGTCGWIFNNTEFKTWMSSAKDRDHLWIKGKPGKSLPSYLGVGREPQNQGSSRTLFCSGQDETDVPAGSSAPWQNRPATRRSSSSMWHNGLEVPEVGSVPCLGPVISCGGFRERR